MVIEIGEAAVEGIYGAMFHNLALSPPSLGWTATTERGAAAAAIPRGREREGERSFPILSLIY